MFLKSIEQFIRKVVAFPKDLICSYNLIKEQTRCNQISQNTFDKASIKQALRLQNRTISSHP
jgi:hypothetical protein